MENLRTEKKHTAVLVFMVLLIGLTRGITLQNQIEIHPDEWVFYESTNSMMSAIFGFEKEFVEAKEYPEGAYIFYLPFHILGFLWGKIGGADYDLSVWGRIGSVFYFLLTALLGFRILRIYPEANVTSERFFGLAMCFSLFFIEHSRYGTGDMISIFLLFLVIYLCEKSCTYTEKFRMHWYIFVICGFLGAVKYPLLFFLSIPLVCNWYLSKERFSRKCAHSVFYVGLCVVGLLAASPKAMRDLNYFIRVAEREMNAYVLEGTGFESGGILNHIASIVVYSALYADIPLGIFMTFGAFFGCGARLMKQRKSGKEIQPLEVLLCAVVPLTTIIFFIYNLFPQLLIFRTYTPFFALSLLYASIVAGNLWEQRGWRRVLIGSMMLLMVCRGIFLIYVMALEEETENQMIQKVESCVDHKWRNTVIVGSYYVPLDHETLYDSYERYTFEEYMQNHEDNWRLDSGTLLLTGACEYYIGQKYIVPVSNCTDAGLEVSQEIFGWETFKEWNSDYYIGQSYPDLYYLLFGGWIRGGTLSTTVLPCNQIYYRPE